MSYAKDERSRYWLGVISGQQRSGLTTVDYCRRRGISTGSFYQWKNRLNIGPGSSPPEPQSKKPSLVPVELVSELPFPGITIELPNGIRLRTADVKTAVEAVRQLSQGDLP